MDLQDLSRNNVRLMFEIKTKKVITSRTQTIYGGLGFYGAKEFLLKNKLVSNSGKTKTNQKNYILTDRGLKIVNMIDRLQKLLNEV